MKNDALLEKKRQYGEKKDYRALEKIPKKYVKNFIITENNCRKKGKILEKILKFREKK